MLKEGLSIDTTFNLHQFSSDRTFKFIDQLQAIFTNFTLLLHPSLLFFVSNSLPDNVAVVVRA
jgi:hypothetical protein